MSAHLNTYSRINEIAVRNSRTPLTSHRPPVSLYHSEIYIFLLFDFVLQKKHVFYYKYFEIEEL